MRDRSPSPSLYLDRWKVDRPQLLPLSEPLVDAETGLFTKLSYQARSFSFLPQKEYPTHIRYPQLSPSVFTYFYPPIKL
jgi:hypothetical protein